MSTRRYIKSLREKRRKLIKDSQDLHDRALSEDRMMSAEEFGRHRERMDEAQEILKQVESLEEQLEVEASIDDLGEVASPDPVSPGATGSPAPIPTSEIPEGVRALIPEGWELVPRSHSRVTLGGSWCDVAARFCAYEDVRKNRRASREYNQAFENYLGGRRLTEGQRNLLITADVVADSDAEGGFLVAPIQVVAQLLQELDDEVFLRRWARTFTVRRAQSLGVPTRASRVNTFRWGGETTPPQKDKSLKFGGREFTPHEIRGSLDISRKMLRSSILPIVQLINRELARDAGEKHEDSFLVGTGAGQPLGIFVASNKGISAARDVSQGNLATTMKFDGLKRAKMSIRAGYRRRSTFRFLTSREGVLQLSLEKDGNNRPLWEDSVQAGEPDRVLGVPAAESERVPNTFTSGNYVGMFGDFSQYWIADAIDSLAIQRLIEVRAEEGFDRFIAELSTDGMPVLEEAFARVQLP